MKANTLRYGMIGCGMMGQEHLRNMALLPQAQAVAIYEPDADMRAAALALAPHARAVDSMEAVIDAADVDALVITSPNFCHRAGR